MAALSDASVGSIFSVSRCGNAAISPTLILHPCSVASYAWICREGSRITVRREAIRLVIFTRHSAVPQHLGAHIQRRLAPVLALAPPAMRDHMLPHLDRWRWGELDHLPTPRSADPSQPTGAHRTRPYPVCANPRRRFPTPPRSMLRLPLLARLLLTGF